MKKKPKRPKPYVCPSWGDLDLMAAWEAGELLGLSASWVRDLALRGDLPHIKIPVAPGRDPRGACVLYPRDALIWWHKHKRRGRGPPTKKERRRRRQKNKD